MRICLSPGTSFSMPVDISTPKLARQWPHRRVFGFEATRVINLSTSHHFCSPRDSAAWRYWEAVTQLHVMYSKWADAFSQFQGFAQVTVKAAQEKNDEEKVKPLGGGARGGAGPKKRW